MSNEVRLGEVVYLMKPHMYKYNLDTSNCPIHHRGAILQYEGTVIKPESCLSQRTSSLSPNKLLLYAYSLDYKSVIDWSIS